MADVFRLAAQYRNRLRSELAQVDDFLQLVDELSSDAGPRLKLVPEPDAAADRPENAPAAPAAGPASLLLCS